MCPVHDALRTKPRMTRSISGLGPPEPAWKKAPSWAVVARGDNAAEADVVRSMAERAGATITEAEGCHVIMMSRPEIVVDVILSAVAALQDESKWS